MGKEQKNKRYFKGEKGQKIVIQDDEGNYIQASVRIKAVRCGKPNCKQCPHKMYAYAKYREGKKTIEKYLGVVKKER